MLLTENGQRRWRQIVEEPSRNCIDEKLDAAVKRYNVPVEPGWYMAYVETYLGANWRGMNDQVVAYLWTL